MANRVDQLRAHFEAGLEKLCQRWTERHFAVAYLAYERDIAAAAGSMDPRLFEDIIRFREWHNYLRTARDKLTKPTQEDMRFDRALTLMMERQAKRLQERIGVGEAEQITISCWRGRRGRHFLRAVADGRTGESYRLEGGIDVVTD
jgi:hypothetical protein